jgi:3-hydroxyanthranilate 3,4-dioxygenase
MLQAPLGRHYIPLLRRLVLQAIVHESETSPMDEMKAVNLGEVMNTIRGSGHPNTVLWQAPDSIAFVARGREFRSEFHSDPSDEVMYMIKGDMNLH